MYTYFADLHRCIVLPASDALIIRRTVNILLYSSTFV